MAISLDKIDRLKSQLLTSGLSQQNSSLYQVINLLIGIAKELAVASNNSSSDEGSSSVINNYIKETIMIESGSGEDGEAGPPGVRGIDGIPGAQGPQGPITLGPMGLDGINGDDGFPIPGATGPQGIKGDTGATGPQFPAMIVLQGEDGEDGLTIPGPPGAGGGGGGLDYSWEFVESRACSGNQHEDFINLSIYSEILVFIIQVTRSAAVASAVQVSVDNGANFLATVGDYVAVAATGVETNADSIRFSAASSTAARSGQINIRGFNVAGAPRAAIVSSAFLFHYMPSIVAFNAVRVTVSSGTQNAGDIYVFGRR